MQDNAGFSNDLGSLANYSFIITNSADQVILTVSSNSFNFELLPASEYHVYGVSFFGVLNASGNISNTSASICATVSSNYLVVYLNEYPSIANAGNDQQLCGATQTTLFAPPPQVGFGTWMQVSGPSTATILTPNAVFTAVTNLVGGVYEFQLINQNGACSGVFASRDTVVVNNIAIVQADAGPDQIVCSQTSTSLAGNLPGSGNGVWTQITGNPSTIINPFSPTSTVTGLSTGNYDYVWRITDGPCVTTDTVRITVAFGGTVAAAGPDLQICEQTALSLSGNIPVLGGGVWNMVSGPSGTIVNPNANNSLVTGLQQGNYVFAWTITNGICVTSDTVEWELFENPSLTLQSVTNVSGPGAMDGTIEVCATGGNAPYTISSNPPVGTIAGPTISVVCNDSYTLSNLAGGNYDIYLEDANGCVDTLFAVLVFEVDCSQFLFQSGNSTNITCHGDNDGSISIFTQGGDPGYSYSIGNGIPDTTVMSSSFVFENLPAGLYSNITVTDNNGCVVMYPFQFLISEPPELMISATAVPETNIGLSNGMINLCIDGGTPGYTVTLTPNLGFQNNQGMVSCDANYQWTNLPPSNYQIIVEDATGCSSTIQSILVSSPSCLIAIDSVVINNNPLCFGESNGSITIFGSGSSSYQYSLDGGLTFTSTSTLSNRTFSNLTAGSYDIVIRDGNFCQAVYNSNPVVLVEPSDILAAANTTNSSSLGNDGAIEVCVVGGTPGYIVTYTSGMGGSGTFLDLGPISCQGNFELTGLSPDTYDVLVTDANGCTHDISGLVIMTADCSAFTLDSVSTTNVLCSGDDSGTVTVAVGSGGAPFMYVVNDGLMSDTISMLNDTINVITGLGAGNYTITVIDDFQCSVSTTVQITEPTTPVNPGIVSINPSSIGVSDGQICISPTGGVPPYSVTATCGTVTPGGGTGCAGQFNVSNLGPGACTITISDASGCILQEIITLTNPACTDFELLSVQAVNISCTGEVDGSITMMVSGGNGPYQYSIDNGFQFANSANATFTFPGLAEGSNYEIVVKDNLGCTSTYSSNPVSVIEPDPIALNFNTIASCIGQATGRIDLTVLGGTSPYNYSWSNGEFIEDISNLAPGSYSVTVNDENLCEQTGSVIITELDSVTVDAGPDISFFVGESAAVSVAISELPPFDVLWTPAAGVDDPIGDQVIVSPTETTNYIIEVTSREGCIGRDSLLVNVTPRGVVAVPTGFTPNADGHNDTFIPIIQGGSTLKVFRVFNRWGEVIHDNTSPWDGTYKGNDQPVGTYVFVAEYTDDQNAAKTINGHIALLR